MTEPRLSKLEQQVFRAWLDLDRDYSSLPFQAVSGRSGVPLHQIRRAVRSIARKGLLQYAKGLWTDDGVPAGAGYGLTDAGAKYLQEIE